MLSRCSFAAAFWIVLAHSLAAAEPTPTSKAIREAIVKALPLIQKGTPATWLTAPASPAIIRPSPSWLRPPRGCAVLRTDEEELPKHLRFIADFLDRNRKHYLKGQGQGGQVDTAGYALWTLEMGGWKPDQTTAAVAEYLLLRNKDLDHSRQLGLHTASLGSQCVHPQLSGRAPCKPTAPRSRKRGSMSASAAARLVGKDAGQGYGGPCLPSVGASACAFRGSRGASGGAGTPSDSAARRRWAQIDKLKSDAYATGTALTALHEAAELATNDPVYQRGIKHLLATQREDGTWYVRSRSKPFQTYSRAASRTAKTSSSRSPPAVGQQPRWRWHSQPAPRLRRNHPADEIFHEVLTFCQPAAPAKNSPCGAAGWQFI